MAALAGRVREYGLPDSDGRRQHVVDGLDCVGVPFLRKVTSPLLFGVGEDASVVARAISDGEARA
jgi:hypothetical protein